MATISIARKHALSHKKAKDVAEKIAKDLNKRFELDYAWSGDHVDFERPGVSGRMLVAKDKISLDVNLGWLLTLRTSELNSDTIEPPVPSGLGDLSAPLRGLADFLRIDSDLIDAAVECSDEQSAPALSRANLARWVAKLPSQEKDTVIAALLKGEDLHIGDELRQRAMREIRGAARSGRDTKKNERRRVMQLAARAGSIAKEKRPERAALLLAMISGFQVMRQMIGLSALAKAKDAHLAALLTAVFDTLIEPKEPTRTGR